MMHNGEPIEENNVSETNDENAQEDNVTELNTESTDSEEIQADSDNQEMAEKVSALELEVADLKDKMLRALAEADNVRRRAEQDKIDAAKFGVSNFAKALLSVADNFRRALDSIPAEEVENNEFVKNLMTGIEATEREMLNAFESAGIKKLDPMGDVFDPNFHEVMFESEAAGQEPGTIIQVIETGYMIHDRLLRPARVGVVKGSAEDHSVDTVA